jgi:hypothetical protein
VLQQLQIVVWGWNFLLFLKLFAKKFFLDWAPDILTDPAADFVEDRHRERERERERHPYRDRHRERDIHIETERERDTHTHTHIIKEQI